MVLNKRVVFPNQRWRSEVSSFNPHVLGTVKSCVSFFFFLRCDVSFPIFYHLADQIKRRTIQISVYIYNLLRFCWVSVFLTCLEADPAKTKRNQIRKGKKEKKKEKKKPMITWTFKRRTIQISVYIYNLLRFCWVSVFLTCLEADPAKTKRNQIRKGKKKKKKKRKEKKRKEKAHDYMNL